LWGCHNPRSRRYRLRRTLSIYHLSNGKPSLIGSFTNPLFAINS
jgi:hypothetical protein